MTQEFVLLQLELLAIYRFTIKYLKDGKFTEDSQTVNIIIQDIINYVVYIAQFNHISSWKIRKHFENQKGVWEEVIQNLRRIISVNCEIKQFEDVSFTCNNGIIVRKNIRYLELSNIFPTGYTKEKYKLFIDKLTEKISLIKTNYGIKYCEK